jgi:glycosyltransferase involved in cell wall biosynthesis
MKIDEKVYTVDVSIVVAVRNEEKHIKEAINSLVSQKGLKVEVIVIDDNSTDATFAILEELAAKHAHLHVTRNPNPGKARAFSLGVEKAKGRFVCLFAGDDIMPEGSLLERYNVIKDHLDSSLVVGLSKLRTMSENKKYDGHLIPAKKGKGGFTGTSYLMGRGVTELAFPVPSQLPNEDSWLYLAIVYLQGVKLVDSDIISNYWRVHDGNSINMMVGFEEYNRKLTPRMYAHHLFYETYQARLSAKHKKTLQGLIACEDYRKEGRFMAILFTTAPLVEKLRAISACNSTFYNFRKRLFSFFSGWQ